MQFSDVLINTEHRFSIGQEDTSGRYYLSIPVSTSVVDYEEYYEISAHEFERFRSDLHAALEFAERCRRGQMGARRITPARPR